MQPRADAVAVLALAVLASSCAPDSHDPTGPSVETVDVSPRHGFPSNGGVLPEVISEVVGETEIHLFTFTPVNGDPSSYTEIEGSPWGVWFGMRDTLIEDPPTGNTAWAFEGGHENLPSPSANADTWLHPQSQLFFDPPVRRVSFWYASDLHDGFGSQFDSIPDDAFYFIALDTLGYTVMYDSIRANQVPPTWPDAYPRDDWTKLTIDAGGEDRIYRIFFNGRMHIDDLEIVRAAQPTLECGSTVRGQVATCTVLEQVDSIAGWHFKGDIPDGGPFSVDTLLSEEVWSGRVALSGLVSVDVFIDDSLHTFSDSLLVDPRRLDAPPWRWDSRKWSYEPGGGLECSVFLPYVYPNDSITVAENRSTEDCRILAFTPRTDDLTVIDSTFKADSIFDGGPNHGLFFVAEAYFEMKHGSYFNPSVRSDAAGSLVTSADNLKDCKERTRTSLSLNLHQFNLGCTKPPEQRTFSEWWDAQEAHEAYGTPGHGPPNNGHQKQRELAAALPENDPYRIVEPLVAASRLDLESIVQSEVHFVDQRVEDLAGNHNVVQGNWGTYDPQSGLWCGHIYAYWIDRTPAEYLLTNVCGYQ